MTELHKYIVPLVGFGALVICADMISSAIRLQDTPEVSKVGRWTVQQNMADGWLVFDSVEGRMCTIPNASSGTQQANCAPSPPR